jgi:hypothetical protein
MPGFLSEETFWEQEGGSALLQTNTHSFVSGDKRDGYSNDVDNDDHFPVTSSSFIRPCLRSRLPGARLGRSVRWHRQRNSRQFSVSKMRCYAARPNPHKFFASACVFMSTHTAAAAFEVDVDAASHVFKVALRCIFIFKTHASPCPP